MDLSFYVSTFIAQQVHLYIGWKQLPHNTPASVWLQIQKHFCSDITFKDKFTAYKKNINLSHQESLIYFMNYILQQPINTIPKIMWQNKDFVISYINNYKCVPHYVSPQLQHDSEVLLYVVQWTPNILRRMSTTHWSPNYMCAIVSHNGLALEFLSTTNKNVVHTAVAQNGMALQFATPEYKGDFDIVLEAVQQNGMAYQFASNNLKQDKKIIGKAITSNAAAFELLLNPGRDVVLEMVQRNGEVIRYTDAKWRQDCEIMFIAQKSFNNAILYADDSIKYNKDFIMRLVKGHWVPIEILPEMFKADPDIIYEMTKYHWGSLQYADASLKSNPTFILKLIKITPRVLMFVDPKLYENKAFVGKALRINSGVRDYGIKAQSSEYDGGWILG